MSVRLRAADSLYWAWKSFMGVDRTLSLRAMGIDLFFFFLYGNFDVGLWICLLQNLGDNYRLLI